MTDTDVTTTIKTAAIKTAYYGHCLALYGTPQEERDLETIRQLGFIPVNPNCKECADGYKASGMDFFKQFTERCEVMVFRALPDGSIPAGIAKEIEYFQLESKPVIELPSMIKRRVLTVDETRDYLKEVGQR